MTRQTVVTPVTVYACVTRHASKPSHARALIGPCAEPVTAAVVDVAANRTSCFDIVVVFQYEIFLQFFFVETLLGQHSESC